MKVMRKFSGIGTTVIFVTPIPQNQVSDVSQQLTLGTQTRMLGSVAIQNPVSADRLNFRKSLSRSQSVGARRSIAYERRRNVGQHERQQRRVPLNPHTHHSSPSRTLPSTSFRKDVSLDVVRDPLPQQQDLQQLVDKLERTSHSL